MAQPFDCNCGTPSCRGRISGAKDMKAAELQGTWLNGHIRAMLEGREATLSGNGTCANRQQQPGDGSLAKGTSRAAHAHADDPTAQALRDALLHAEKVVEAARLALVSYRGTGGARRHGPTSRELSGEMAGDTVRV